MHAQVISTARYVLLESLRLLCVLASWMSGCECAVNYCIVLCNWYARYKTRSRLAWTRLKLWLTVILIAVFTSTVIFLLSFQKDTIHSALDFFLNPYLFLLPLLTLLVILLIGGLYFIPHTLQDKQKILVDSLDTIFDTVYAKELISAAADTYKYVHILRPFCVLIYSLLSFSQGRCGRRLNLLRSSPLKSLGCSPSLPYQRSRPSNWRISSTTRWRTCWTACTALWKPRVMNEGREWLCGMTFSRLFCLRQETIFFHLCSTTCVKEK